MKTTAFLISNLLIFVLSSCSPGENNKKPEGVLTNSQEKTLEKAKQIDAEAKAIEDKRLKDLDEAEGKKIE